MRLCVVGTGYVGIVTAACLADSGNDVVGVDIDAEKVACLNEGRATIFEPGLEELLRANLEADRLRFTTKIDDGISDADVAFIAVGTPTGADGQANLQYVDAAAHDIARSIRRPTTVVIKSTVPVGTTRRVGELIAKHTAHETAIAHNPEFLKEGSAVDDFLRPDRVVVGTVSDDAHQILVDLHHPFVLNKRPIMKMSPEASEMVKYAANAYLATRISFINEIAAICEKLDVDVDDVRRGMGADARIGDHFLYAGIGYGGSCFPKDVLALLHTARAVEVSADILDAVDRRNHAQQTRMFDRIRDRFDGRLSGRRIAVWGLAFKPKTDDVRDAPALAIVERLVAAGADVRVHDPRALESAKAKLGDRVTHCTRPYEAIDGADALLICTEWMEYRSPDFDRMRSAMASPIIFDGRNIYDRQMPGRAGFEYHSVGRPSV